MQFLCITQQTIKLVFSAHKILRLKNIALQHNSIRNNKKIVNGQNCILQVHILDFQSIESFHSWINFMLKCSQFWSAPSLNAVNTVSINLSCLIVSSREWVSRVILSGMGNITEVKGWNPSQILNWGFKIKSNSCNKFNPGLKIFKIKTKSY
jgi:hypothetical protein